MFKRVFMLGLLALLVSCKSILNTNEFYSLTDLCDKTLNGKPALVFFTMEGCDMCDLFEMRVLSDPQVCEYINEQFTFYKVNVKKNTIFNKLGHVYSFPMFAFIDHAELKLFLSPSRNIEMFLLSLKNYAVQPLEYNILELTKFNGDAKNVADAIRMAFSALYYKEKESLSDKEILEILEESVDKWPYLYNCYLLAGLYEKMNMPEVANELYKNLNVDLSPFDEFIYADELPFILSKHFKVDMSKCARINFDNKICDFGNVKKEQPVFHKFPFRNNSDQPLLIYNVISSCGCTVVNYPNYPILPNESDTISLSFNSKNIGTFNKSIFILSNATEKRVALNIRGIVFE